eukprot:Gb_00211 [translate_table: standard]
MRRVACGHTAYAMWWHMQEHQKVTFKLRKTSPTDEEVRSTSFKMCFLGCGYIDESSLLQQQMKPNMELGERVAGCILKLEPEDASAYVLLSNIYVAFARWDDLAKMRKMMKDRGVKKEPRHKWIEFKSKVHSFVVGDNSHPKTKEIYAKLEELSSYMKTYLLLRMYGSQMYLCGMLSLTNM